MRKAVRDFAEAMEAKLQAKDADYGEEGWLEDDHSIIRLRKQLALEVHEARIAFEECDPQALAAECIDIANFAMMIFDRLKHIRIGDDIQFK